MVTTPFFHPHVEDTSSSSSAEALAGPVLRSPSSATGANNVEVMLFPEAQGWRAKAEAKALAAQQQQVEQDQQPTMGPAGRGRQATLPGWKQADRRTSKKSPPALPLVGPTVPVQIAPPPIREKVPKPPSSPRPVEEPELPPWEQEAWDKVELLD